jgi:hypothetical protein
VINFYKTDPVEDMGLKPRGQRGSSVFPIVRKVHLRDMLGKAAYQRIRGRFFRIHYQFISANRRKYYYDFFLICFGPYPMSAIRDDPGTSVFPAEEVAL